MYFFIRNKNWIYLSLLVLSGCVSLPQDEQTKNILSLPSVDKSVNNSIESGFFSIGDWPEKNWWDVFESSQLSSLIEESLEQNPSILAIKRRIEFAKQTAKVAKAKLFPLLSFDADDNWSYLSKNGLYRALNPKVPINPNLIDLTLSFTYEFDFWFKNTNLFRAAFGREKAEQAEASQVELITTTAVAQAYFALKTNLQRKHLYKKLYEASLNIFNLQRLLEEKDLFSKLTPLFGEEDVLEIEKQLVQVEEAIARDKHLLNILIGKGPDEPLEVDENFPSLPDSIVLPATLSLDLLARRPDLMAQIWRVESLAHEVGAAKADFYPNVNLTALAGLESTAYSLLFQSSSETGSLIPAIHLPIFTAGAIRANVRAKKAAFDEAVFDYNNLILRSTQEVSDLLVLAHSVFQQKELQDQIVQDAKQRYELVILRHQKGLDSLIAQYTMELEYIEKELENVNLLYGQYLATIKLIKALGGGYESQYGVPLKAQGESS